MARFPSNKTGLDVLADALAAGIAANPEHFPAQRGEAFDISALTAFTHRKNLCVSDRLEREVAFRLAMDAEDAAYQELVLEMRRLLDLAEHQHRAEPEILELIGWGLPTELRDEPPGQPRALEAVVQGPGNVLLDWKAPSAGAGSVSYYRVDRKVTPGFAPRHEGEGVVSEDWGLWVRTTLATWLAVSTQPLGAEIEYRVTAVNANGPGARSDPAAVIL